MPQTDCAAARAQLSAYLDGELDKEAVQGLLEHVSTCVECATFFKTFAKTVKLYDDLPKPVLSADAQERLKRTVEIP